MTLLLLSTAVAFQPLRVSSGRLAVRMCAADDAAAAARQRWLNKIDAENNGGGRPAQSAEDEMRARQQERMLPMVRSGVLIVLQMVVLVMFMVHTA